MTKERLTILQVLPALHSGGIERTVVNNSSLFVAEGYRSIVISNGGRMVGQLEEQGSVHIQAAIGSKTPAVFRNVLWLRNHLLKIRPDVVHLHSRLPSWIGYLAWKSIPATKRPRLVTWVHGFNSVSSYSAIQTYGERVVVVSESVKQFIHDEYPSIPIGKVVVIPGSVDTSRYFHDYYPSDEWLSMWESELPQTRGKNILLLPARISRWKGAPHFIQIVRSLKAEGMNVHGLIVGETERRHATFLTELKKEVETLALNDSISFLPHRDDLRDIMAVSRIVFSLSTRREAFGLASLEALSLGIPVIGFAHGGVDEQLRALFPEGRVAVGDVNEATKRAIGILSRDSTPSINENKIFTKEHTRQKLRSIVAELIETNED